jgi:allophanate hydrolase
LQIAGLRLKAYYEAAESRSWGLSESIATLVARHAAGQKIAETIEATYAKIAEHADPALFIAVRPKEDALALAADVEAAGPVGKPLYGVPFAVKDNIDVAGLPTTAACPAFAYTPENSSFVVAKLEAAGAIVIGKTNLDQFATGLVGVRSPYGTPRNALRPDLIPGGSSSGSATAVGAGLVPFSLGTDTAGSGRVPAALNGIVGLKPSLGYLSGTGLVPACRTLDTISIFALDIADAFAAFTVAAGYDDADAYSRPLPAPRLVAPPPNLRVGVPKPSQRLFLGDAAGEVAYTADIAKLESLGARLVEFDLEPFFEVARLLYEGPWVAERYAATKSLIETRPDTFHPVTLKIIEGARKFDAVSAFEATYKLAALKRKTAKTWANIDVMAVPTMPRVYTVAEVLADPVRTNSNNGVYTNFVNLLDLSAIAYPSGMRSDGLPSSLTLIAASGRDGLIATLAAKAHAISGAPMGATGREASSAPEVARPEGIEIAVVGAHLSGLPLNRELTDLGATFVRETKTSADYRLFALPDTIPPKPGLLRVGAGEGAKISVEIWSLSPAAFGAFVAAIPSPLGVGSISFEDGSRVKGFLVEAEAVKGAEDVSAFGGWRAYVAR